MESNIGKRKLSFWSKAIFSVQGIKHYKDVLKDTVGKSIIYLLLLSLLLGAVGSLRGAIDTNNGISQFIKIYNDKCPDFELKDGQLSVTGDMPLVLSKDNNYYFVIDTTNNTSTDVLNSYDRGILILKDKLIEKQSGAQTQIFDFKSLQGSTINKKQVNVYLPLIKLVIPLIFIGNIIWYFLGGLLSALFLALLALIINGVFKTNFKYGQLYSISIYALTTPLIIDTILKIVGIEHFSYYWLAYHIIGFGYICFALNKFKNSNTANDLRQL